MNGHVFEVPAEKPHPEQFSKTVEALKSFAMSELEYPTDAISDAVGGAAVTIEKPTTNLDADGLKNDPVADMILKDEVTEYRKRLKARDANKIKLYAVI